MAVGAYLNDGNGENKGHVKVYKWENESWTQIGNSIEGQNHGDEQLGWQTKLSADGTFLATSSWKADYVGRTNNGVVRVFEWDGSSWNQVGSPLAETTDEDKYGTHLSFSRDGKKIAIGVPGLDNDNGDDSGAVQTREWVTSEGAYSFNGARQVHGINGSGLSNNSFSNDGKIIAVGGIFANEETGYASVYQRDEENQWVQLGSDLVGESTGDHFGLLSLSGDGKTLAIGADLNDTQGDDSGQIKVYRYINDQWSQIGSTINGETAGDQLGFNPLLSRDGTLLIVPVINANTDNGESTGEVRIYSLVDTTSTNNAPVASNQSVEATEQTEKTITLSGSDDDGDELKYIITSLPSNGKLFENDTLNKVNVEIKAEDLPRTLGSLGSEDVIYTSTSDTADSDGFNFKVNDGTDDSNEATVSINITLVNDQPIAGSNSESPGVGNNLTGVWVVAPEANSLMVGPGWKNGDWWNISEDDVTTRACYFDDLYVFNFDGSFENVLGDETWLESWQGVDSDRCGTPISPHDGSGSYTFVDNVNSTFTLKGKGAYIGLPKVINGAEISSNDDAPEERLYRYEIIDENSMYVGLEFAAGAWWTYKLVKSNDTFLASQLLDAVEQTPIEFDLTGSDPDGDDLSYIIETLPLDGTLINNGVEITSNDLPATISGSTVTYTSISDNPTQINRYRAQSDYFYFYVNDGKVDSKLGALMVNIQPVNDAPIAENTNVDIVRYTETEIALQASDPDLTIYTPVYLNYIITSLPENGILKVDGETITDEDLPLTLEEWDNKINYVINSENPSSDSFDFKVNDGEVDSEKATVTINVKEANIITISAENSEFDESQTNIITATITNSEDSDIYINLSQFTGTASRYFDFDISYDSIGENTIYKSNIFNDQDVQLADLNTPIGLDVDDNGNVYVADVESHRVIKFSAETLKGTIVAGGNWIGDGLSQLNLPISVALDSEGAIYVADQSNHRIVKWIEGESSGVVVAGGNGEGDELYQLRYPRHIIIDENDNLYISDNGNHRVLKWNYDTGRGKVIAGGNGDGDAKNQLSYPHGIFVDNNGSVYVADRNNQRVVKWNSGSVEYDKLWYFNSPQAVHVDFNGNIIVSEKYQNSISIVDPKNEDNRKVIVGGNGSGSNDDQFNSIMDFKIDRFGNIYASDLNNQRVKKIQNGAQILIRAGEQTGSFNISGLPDVTDEDDKTIIFNPLTSTSAVLQSTENIELTLLDNDEPSEVTFNYDKEYLYEEKNDSIVINLNLSKSSEKTIKIHYTPKGTAELDSEYLITPSPIEIKPGETSSQIIISNVDLDDDEVEILETIEIFFESQENVVNDLSSLVFNLISDDNPTLSTITVTDHTSNEENNINEGEDIIITAGIDSPSSKDIIISFDISGDVNSSDYSATSIKTYQNVPNPEIYPNNNKNRSKKGIDRPRGLYVDGDRNIYIADEGNHRVVKWSVGAYEGEVVAGGNDTGGGDSDTYHPFGVFVDSNSNLYVSEHGKHRVMKWEPGASRGILVAGDNGSGNANNQLSSPKGIYFDEDNNYLYISDTNNHRILRWEIGASEGVVVAGGNDIGNELNQLNYPTGVNLDSDGNLLIADTNNHRVLKWVIGESQGSIVAGGFFDRPWENNLISLQNPHTVATDSKGNMYVPDYYRQVVKKYSKGSDEPVVVMGSMNNDGNAYDRLYNPYAIYVDEDDNIFVSDEKNHRIISKIVNVEILIKAGETTGSVTINTLEDSSNESSESLIIKPNKFINII